METRGIFYGPAVLLGSGGGDSTGSVANVLGKVSVGAGTNDVLVVAAGVASGDGDVVSAVGATGVSAVGATGVSTVGSVVGTGGSVGTSVGAVVGAVVGAIVGGGGIGV